MKLFVGLKNIVNLSFLFLELNFSINTRIADINIAKGIYCKTFEESAIKAMSDRKSLRDTYKLCSNSKDIIAIMAFAECYNGLGYYNKNRVSPHVFSGTNVSTKGKYTGDEDYSASTVDKQPGIYILIKMIIKRLVFKEVKVYEKNISVNIDNNDINTGL